MLDPSTGIPTDFPSGAVLLIDKPLGWTSFDVVNKVRYWLGKRLQVKRVKVGHAGTLDPLATGLLVICVGDYTRRIDTFQAQEKEYTGTITFGAITPSFDLEKPPSEIFPVTHLTPERIEQARHQFIGEITQLPPIFSAVKVDGKRMYKNARTGQDVELQPRSVEVSVFDVMGLRAVPSDASVREPANLAAKGTPIWQHPEYAEGLQSDFRVVCSKGTYIRSLAYDLGQAVDSGAYLSALRRTRIGAFSIESAWNLDDLIDQIRAGV